MTKQYTIQELILKPLKDKEFIRFLKEYNALWPYIRSMYSFDSKKFQKETLSSKSFTEAFFDKRSYIQDGFNYSQFQVNNWFNINWSDISQKWQKKIGYNW